ncbi:MAG: type II toxin-antitoxin system RelE/ParE family toxin [Ilumatobacteraceae bacterium]
MPKPVRLRRLAADDIDTAVAYLLAEAGTDVAAKLIDAIEAALAHVGRYPHNGTLRFSYELDIPALRAWPVPGFPYLVFYLERDDEVDVWRILHTRRDIRTTLAENDEQ